MFRQHGRTPAVHLMALAAVGVQTGHDMVRVSDTQILVLMTFDAACCIEREIAARETGVATYTVYLGMPSYNGEV